MIFGPHQKKLPKLIGLCLKLTRKLKIILKPNSQTISQTLNTNTIYKLRNNFIKI